MRVLRPLVLSLLLVLGGGITALSAQNREVSGKVLDANQQPLWYLPLFLNCDAKIRTIFVTSKHNRPFLLQLVQILRLYCLICPPNAPQLAHDC